MLRCEKASRIPSIANEVINDQPPWLTNGSVMPVIGQQSQDTPDIDYRLKANECRDARR